MIKTIIVDDHILFREGLKAILGSEPDIEIVGQAGTVEEAVEIVGAVKPDIVLMDFSLPDGTGADATRRVLAQHPQCKVLFLTMSEQDEDLFAAVRSGAKGYLLKSLQPSKLVEAIRSVQHGESALSRAMTLRVMEELSRTKPPELPVDPRLAQLTGRELDVLHELASGKSNQEIAAVLFLAENTVKYHVHSIFGKLHLPDRKALGAFAREHGLMRGKV
jgi:DNA-binding NarL/FixJ family response regulator